MRILAVGGGSGGHVTPIAAVLTALRDKGPDTEFKVWCDRKFSKQTRESIRRFDEHVPVETIFSGKLRRYHTLPLWKQILRFRSIVLPNVRDGFFIGIGFLQSVYKLWRWRPDVIFCKGGYVCMPVGLAARLFGIPIVLHDSDAHPGLTNRVLAKYAMAIGTGAPLEHYKYPPSKARYVGIPIDEKFHAYDKNHQISFKKNLGFSDKLPLVVITGGGLGAQAINEAIVSIADELTQACSVLLISGTKQYEAIRKSTSHLKREKFQLHAFIASNIVEVLAAADLVVARAGATTLLELAALAKPTIIIPNPYLTGGHQLKNAHVYSRRQASVIVDENRLVQEPHELLDTINALVLNPKELERMSAAIHTFAKPEAANDMAELILGATK